MAYDPLTGVTETTAGTLSRSAGFDAAGNVTAFADGRLQDSQRTITYDALGRPTQISYVADPTATETDTYDSYFGCTFGAGRLCRVQDGAGETRFAYDAHGRVVTESRFQFGGAFITSYAYDALGNVTSMTYPGGRIVSHARDPLGRLTSIATTVNGQPVTLASGRTYNGAGQLTSQLLGNGLVETRGYDLAGRLVTQQIGPITRAYGYDDAGNLASFSEDTFNRTLGYDLLDRLTDASAVTGPTEAFSYDANGNRLSVTTNGTPIAYGYTPGTNRLQQVGATQRGYDGAGNTVSDEARSYLYSAAGDLKEVKSGATTLATYRYDFRHRRTRRQTPTAWTEQFYGYDLDGRRIATSVYQTGALESTYLYADGEPLAMIQRAYGTGPETLVYLHADHLHTPRTATSTSGTTVWRWRGTAFGEAGINDDPDGDGVHVTLDLRYPGQWFDDATGLFDNWHRTYEPATGRYLQSDPIGIAGGINLYLYANANPIRFIDPTGENPALLRLLLKNMLKQGSKAKPRYPLPIPPTPPSPLPDNIDSQTSTLPIPDDIGPFLECSAHDKERNCRDLYNSIIRTCWSMPNGQKRMRCFQAARDTYEECMSQD